MKTYSINECFYSPQGEGHRTGTMNVFLRFAGCNLQCVDASKLGRPLEGNEIDAGFHCDTDFAKGKKLTLTEVVALVKETDRGKCKWVIFTGGEPTLQVDDDLIHALRKEGYRLAIETNGTKKPGWLAYLDWISCSPKPESKVEVTDVHEIRCVVKPKQVPNSHGITARHYFVSPACFAPTADLITGFHGSTQDFSKEAMAWAVKWCESYPNWRISLQVHKILGVR